MFPDLRLSMWNKLYLPTFIIKLDELVQRRAIRHPGGQVERGKTFSLCFLTLSFQVLAEAHYFPFPLSNRDRLDSKVSFTFTRRHIGILFISHYDLSKKLRHKAIDILVSQSSEKAPGVVLFFYIPVENSSIAAFLVAQLWGAGQSLRRKRAEAGQ